MVQTLSEKFSNVDNILADIGQILKGTTRTNEGAVRRILEEIREVLDMSKVRTDVILEEIKDHLSRIALGQGGEGGSGGTGMTQQVGLADALYQAVSQVSEQIKDSSGGKGEVLGKEALEALNKIKELLEKEVETTQTPPMSELDKPFTYINSLGEREIFLLIRDESEKLAGIILAHIDPLKASNVLKMLDIDKQTKIISEISTLKEDENIMEEIQEFLRKKIRVIKMYMDYEPREGYRAAADLLGKLPYKHLRQILETLQRRNPALVKEIKRYLFTFEDIKNMDDRSIQEIIKETNIETLAYALASSPADVREKILNNFSPEMKESLVEEINSLKEIVVPPEEFESKKLKSFEDILKMEPRVIQKLIRILDRNTLRLALKNSPEDIRNKFYASMTERGAAMLREDLDVMPGVSHTLSKEAQNKIVEETNNILMRSIMAQQEIVETAKRLEKEGKISLAT